MNTVAIIQARMESTRLPGKVLVDLQGKPVLARVVDRARRAAALDRVVVATSDAPADAAIARFCEEYGLDCFRGNRDDVLDRYRQAGRAFGAEVVVRLTADCPLLEPRVIDQVVRVFQEGEFDYVSNTLECSYPDGLDVEVLSKATLDRAWHEARWTSQREHVTSYVTAHPELFRLRNVRQAEDMSDLRWTVDEPQDLEFVRAVYGRCGPGAFDMDDVLRLLREYPELIEINRKPRRNEGYARSLEQDRLIQAVDVR